MSCQDGRFQIGCVYQFHHEASQGFVGFRPPAGERSTNPLPVGPTLGHCPAASRFVAAAGGSFQGGGMKTSSFSFNAEMRDPIPRLVYGIESGS